MSILRNNTSIAILQKIVISLVQVNDITIFAAVDEVKNILMNGQPAFTGDYKEGLLNLRTSNGDIDAFFSIERMDAIHAFYTISNLSLREAFKIVFVAPMRILVKIPQNAQHTIDTTVSIILDITSHTVSVHEACESILNYFEHTRNFSVLANEHLSMLRDINYYHVKNIFTPGFISNVTLLAEKQKLEYFIDFTMDSYSESLYQRIDDDSKSMSSAYRNWLACHEENKCEALLEDSYFIDAVNVARANTYFAKYPDELEQRMVNHAHQNPALLDKFMPAVSATLTMTVLNHVAENAAAYEIGAVALLGLFLLRKQIAQLKPSRLFSLFGYKSASEQAQIKYSPLRLQ